jgi:uncharacterized protein
MIATTVRRAVLCGAGGFLALFGLMVVLPAAAQEMTIEEYQPRSTLVVEENPVPRAKYPFIDVHSHQNGANMSAERVAEIVEDMDSLNLQVMVNLSGGTGERLQANVQNLKGRYPGRFVIFANVDFNGIGEPGWGERAAAQLEADVRNGAQGLKIFKQLGLDITDTNGQRVPVDDPRIDPVWAKAGELGIPVLIHSADPAMFWQPMDQFNERWLELKLNPGRQQPPEPSFEQIIGEQHNVFRKHPETRFINAHLGWYGHNLGELSKLMDEMPNMYTELGAVIYELGRQPRAAREFLIRYQDRVMMGKDSWRPEEYPVYFRIFETADEYFDYYRDYHAFWNMYGLDLPDEVLKKIYYKNALAVIPGIDASQFPE